MMTPRPHDLVRLSAAAADTLPADAPAWTHGALRTTPWVVVRRADAPAGFVAVGIRGGDRSQRHAWLVSANDVESVLSPEDLTDVHPPATRDVPAILALTDASALLRESRFTWGPTGSVGFELATGIPTATTDSDLDLLVRVDVLTAAVLARLATLFERLVRMGARVDCQVDTRVGAIALAELVSESSDVLVRTPSGPRLVERDVAMR
jgi:phosphoribosyl-dephospho-CoA transferase